MMHAFALVFTAVTYAALPPVALDKLQMVIAIVALYCFGAALYWWFQCLRERIKERRRLHEGN